MLARLLVAIGDRALATRLATHPVDPFVRVQSLGPDETVLDSESGAHADLILVDGERLGTRAAETGFATAITRLRRGPNGVDVIYFADHLTAEQRAAAVSAGCAAVLDRSSLPGTMEDCLRTAIGSWRARAAHSNAGDRPAMPFRLGRFVSRSPSMGRLIEMARRVAASDSSVLIQGETGVGKERLAHAIHTEGTRAAKPMVVVNCGAIPETLIESELFGHEKGAFTGAHRAHRGHFEMAHGGTILLDEIGELPLQMQVKLLRVLQERKIQRIGAEVTTPVDVRVLAATNRDLKAEVELGRFRSDLFYRLSVVSMTVPPLRERREDIPLMVQTHVEKFHVDLHAIAHRVSAPALAAMEAYDWPGNVREVANVIERALLLSEDDEITLDDLPGDIRACVSLLALPKESKSNGSFTFPDEAWFQLALPVAKRACAEAMEREYLERVLSETGGRIGETAARAGIDPRSLYEKMRRLGLKKEDYKGGEAS